METKQTAMAQLIEWLSSQSESNISLSAIEEKATALLETEKEQHEETYDSGRYAIINKDIDCTWEQHWSQYVSNEAYVKCFYPDAFCATQTIEIEEKKVNGSFLYFLVKQVVL